MGIGEAGLFGGDENVAGVPEVTCNGLMGTTVEAMRCPKDYLDSLSPNPAALLDMTWTVEESNSEFAHLFPGIHLRSNFMQWYYSSPEARDVIINWEEVSKDCIRWLRTDMDHRPYDIAVSEMVTSLMDIPDFASRWEAPQSPPEPEARWRMRDVESGSDVTLLMGLRWQHGTAILLSATVES